jgi:hypothetical protein
MKARLIELGEIVVGATWWGMSWAWGLALTAILLLAPLIFANLAVELIGALEPTFALVIGVVAAYVIGLPPWDAEERQSLLLVVGGTAVSVVAWDLLRGAADAGTLLTALALTVVGWPIRRAVPAWS